MKIWVVGANGLLGSTLCKIDPLHCIPSTKRTANITDLSSLRSFALNNPGITHIVNASAYSQVDLAEAERLDAFRVNAMGPENLARIGIEMGAKVVHISTDYVFPGNGSVPLHEEDLVCPINYYGKTKLDGERKILSLLPSACVIRTSALFGEGGKSFISSLFQMFSEKKTIYLSDDQQNSPTYVEDLALAIFQMLDVSGIYHFSNQGFATKFSFGSMIYEFAKQKALPLVTQELIATPSSFFPSACKRPLYSVFDTSKIGKIISIRPWEDALCSFLQKGR